MWAQPPSRLLGRKFGRVSKFAAIVFGMTAAGLCQTTVNIQPGDDIPSIVAANPAGTTFLIYPGTYRLQNHIVPLTGDSFIGQTACAPPTTTCPAILSGSVEIGSLATFNGTNYVVTGQTQQGKVTEPNSVCQPINLSCNLPEDLFFDGVPYQHLYATSLPTIGPGQWWFDYTNHIIYFHDNPAGHTVETSVLDTAFDSTANNITIQYLTIEEFASPVLMGAVQPAYSGANSSQSLSWLITNCEIFDNHSAGVQIGFATQVLNNYVHNNGEVGVAGGTNTLTATSGVAIKGNTITNNNYAHFDAGFGAGGFKAGTTRGPVIRGNTISNNDGAGIHFDDMSSGPLIDGNVVTYNSGGGGIEYEISLTSAVIRNNVILENGLPDAVLATTASIGSYDSVGVKAYCNVIEIPTNKAAAGMTVVASDRGSNPLSPFEYLAATGNQFHHNTVIWDPTATGPVGYIQKDAANQPNFFASNTPPDYNTYHLPSLSTLGFIYDNNNSQLNTPKTFAAYQAAGGDPHGTADTNNTSGYPTVAITSPVDWTTFTGPITVTATASDKSGISKVEFYADWQLLSTDTTAPYSFTWSSPPIGTHILAVMAYSNAGIRACWSITAIEQ